MNTESCLVGKGFRIVRDAAMFVVVMVLLVAVDARVRAGETVSTRHFGVLHLLPPANFQKPKMIRLVFNPAKKHDDH